MFQPFVLACYDSVMTLRAFKAYFRRKTLIIKEWCAMQGSNLRHRKIYPILLKHLRQHPLSTT